MVEFEVNDNLKIKAFKTMLEGTETYRQTPLDPNIITKPLLYTSKTNPQRLRFPKQK
ncbi:hypothetical protein [Helicobacter sp. MIT 14-3879]|uniref:hypothetical protein n=1 Tax=Helicobacter sp. MIT 14-3879 TaxID=2040649 RepID=UPI0015F18B65|nr:hypothetical protein [Helicobacter sp. MIT 14-3879]